MAGAILRAASLGRGKTRPDALFAVVDLETTGFSPLVGDRIVEVAIIQVSPTGERTDEYVTLVNPKREVGAAHVHGIAQQDADAAPTFEEMAGDVLSRLEGLILVGHNVRYDLDFLGAELSRQASSFPRSLPCARSNLATGCIPNWRTTS